MADAIILAEADHVLDEGNGRRGVQVRPRATRAVAAGARRGEVLVDIAASSVNAIDPRVAGGKVEGHLPYEPPSTICQDLSGTVVTTGAVVTSLAVRCNSNGLTK